MAWSHFQVLLILSPPRYPFINNVHFFADQRVASALTFHYSLIMKSDFDTFLTPGFMEHAPERLTFGIQEYAVMQVSALSLC